MFTRFILSSLLLVASIATAAATTLIGSATTPPTSVSLQLDKTMYIFDGGHPTALAVLSPSSVLAEGANITYTWYVDGKALPPSGESFLEIPPYLGIGNHKVKYTVNYRGKVFNSNEVSFMRCAGEAIAHGPVFLWENNCCNPERLIPIYSMPNSQYQNLSNEITAALPAFKGKILSTLVNSTRGPGSTEAGYAYKPDSSSPKGLVPIINITVKALDMKTQYSGSVLASDAIRPNSVYYYSVPAPNWWSVPTLKYVYTSGVIAYAKTEALPTDLEIFSGLNSQVVNNRRSEDLSSTLIHETANYPVPAERAPTTLFNHRGTLRWGVVVDPNYWINLPGIGVKFGKFELQLEGQYGLTSVGAHGATIKGNMTTKLEVAPFNLARSFASPIGWVTPTRFYRVKADVGAITFEVQGQRSVHASCELLGVWQSSDFKFSNITEGSGSATVSFNFLKIELNLESAYNDSYNHYLPQEQDWIKNRPIAEVKTGFEGAATVAGGVGVRAGAVNNKAFAEVLVGTVGVTLRGEFFGKIKLPSWSGTYFEPKYSAQIYNTWNFDMGGAKDTKTGMWVYKFY